MRLFVLIYSLICSISVYSQTSYVSSKNIYISFEKTTHLIFPSEIKYFSGVNEIILLKKAGKNTLSVKSQISDFGKTNISIATADGKFYAFDVHFTDENKKTNYYVQQDSIGREISTEVNMNNLLHIVLPNPVQYIDYGDNWIQAQPIGNIQNIIRVETLKESTTPTNISVIDSKERFYTFEVSYNEAATNFNLVVGNPQQTALLAKEDLTDNSKEAILEKIKHHGKNIYNLGIKKNSILLLINNIFIADNKLVFRFNLKNNSNVKYDIGYMKFYIVDKKQTKESAEQEVEYKPLFLDNFKNTIEGKADNTYSVCFDKFTIPDKKFFVIEINEKTGGRHLYLKINNRAIENAQAL